MHLVLNFQVLLKIKNIIKHIKKLLWKMVISVIGGNLKLP